LQDFIEGRLRPYKLYLFLNSFQLDKTRREALKRELRKDGRVAVWIYAPGWLDVGPSKEFRVTLQPVSTALFYTGGAALLSKLG
jgi:hypothetical protein